MIRRLSPKMLSTSSNAAVATSATGPVGSLRWNYEDQTLHIYDGTTPGGFILNFSAPENTTPTYTSLTSNSPANEGVTVTFTVTTQNVVDGTTVGYTITGISAGDLSSGSLTGNITITSNIGTVSVTLSNDTTTEGSETMTMTLDATDSAGTNTGSLTSPTVIIDTSTSVSGGALFITNGATYSYVIPSDVTSICAVVVGGGGGSGNSGGNWAGAGGGGGGLAWKNNIAVTPGETLTVGVGQRGTPGGSGGQSYISRGATYLVQASGGTGGSSSNSQRNGGLGGARMVGDGGGSGGQGGRTGNNVGGGGGGGAGGYSGNGGNGGAGNATIAATAGSGGAGGGGNATSAGSRGGGGVGVYGQGGSGSNLGGGGSGGVSGTIAAFSNQITGGNYGGGGGAEEDDTTITGTQGGQGVVRIIWGLGRAFPSTNISAAFSTSGETSQ